MSTFYPEALNDKTAKNGGRGFDRCFHLFKPKLMALFLSCKV